MYNKIFTKILDSSIWMEPLPTRIVWLTFIAAMDETGFVEFASPANVAHRAIVPLSDTLTALAALEGPDINSSDPENEGRRVERVAGGWLVLNAHKYRGLVTKAIKQERTRDRVRAFRAKAKGPCNADVTPANASVTQSVSDAVSISEAEACRVERTTLCTPEDMERAKAIMAADAKPKPPLPVPPKHFRDFRAVHGRLHVGKDEREDWEALFKAYEWDAMHDMHNTLKEDRIFLNTATAWLSKNYEV
jgi:hypothetical protein